MNKDHMDRGISFTIANVIFFPYPLRQIFFLEQHVSEMIVEINEKNVANFYPQMLFPTGCVMAHGQNLVRKLRYL